MHAPSPEPVDAAAPSRRAGPGVFSNSLVNILGLAAVSGLGALGGLITARLLGAVGVGILAVVWGFTDFGRAITSCTHVPSILQVHKGRPISLVFGSSLAVKLIGSTIFTVLILAIAPWLSAAFDVPPSAMLIASTVLLIGSVFEVGAARLEADNRMIRSNLILATGSVVGMGALIAFAAVGQLTIYTSIVTTLVANATMSAGAAIYAYKGLHLRADRALATDMTRYGLRIVAAGLLAQGLIWTDTLMVSFIDGNRAAGIYNVVFQLTFVMVTASTAMGVALVPALSDLAGRGEDTSFGYQRGTLMALALSTVLAVAYVALGPLILALYGDAFTAGYLPLLMLTAFGISAALAVPAAAMLTVHGHAGVLTRLSFAQLAVNIPLNYMLITRMGMLGAAIATTVVFLAGTIVVWMIVRRLTGAWPFSRAAVVEAVRFARSTIRRVFR